MPPVRTIALLLLMSCAGQAATAPRGGTRVLVRFKEGLTPSLQDLPVPAGTLLLEPQRPAPPPGTIPRRPDYKPTPFHILQLPPESNAAQFAANLSRHPALLYAEPDGVMRAGDFVPNDPQAAAQWHHTQDRSRTAWDRTQGSPDVILAVLDTGINASLPDFAGRLLPGYDFVNFDANPADDNGHGTTVTAVAAGTGNNGLAGAGIDWRCRILPLKTLDQNGDGYYSDWISALDHAVTHGADVVNISAGGNEGSQTFLNAIDAAIDAGVILVTITHNDGSGTIRFPGSVAKFITVGATRANGARSSYSNYGPMIDLVAPGGVGSSGNNSTNIVSTTLGGAQGNFWGTSFAAPQVAGTAALIRALRPDIRQAEMETILCAAAIDQVGGPDDTPGFDIFYGHGRLDIPNALTLATARPALEWLGPGQVGLSWPAPTNAAAKKPFAIEYSDDAEHWSPLPPTALLTYSAGTARWTDDGTFTGGPPAGSRFYRSFIRR